MKININKIFNRFVVVASAITLLTSCNKDVETAVPITRSDPAGQSIADVINTDPTFTILKAAVAKAGTSLSTLLADRTGVFTFFAPTDAAFQASGIPSVAALAAFRAGQLDTILRYNLVGGQVLTGAILPSTFPNLQAPSLFALQAPSASLPPGLRMSLFPSKRGTNYWVNNIPLTQTDIQVANGVIHKTAALVIPPSQFLWDRINTDANLTYLKAAIQRADSGVAATSSLQAALSNPAANLTVFAPTNLAFQQLLTGQITQALIAQGVPAATASAQATALASTPAVFTNPALSAVLTPLSIQGLVVYHILGVRAFTVNLPTTATAVPTLLNGGIPTHPGVTVQATFGPTGVTAATVKGLVNSTASNLLINPTPAPGGTSDQLYINGVLHVIDQVLRPQ
ncbi:MAG: fasciclin domain-containing protein [Bacteroidota bacterium]|nr:fasciclin domain-containing protein [Bacteroidota bacterium]